MYTIDNATHDFMLDNERKSLSSETMRYYRENLSRFCTWLAENNVNKACKISQCIIDDYLLYLLRTIQNKTSVNTYMRAVRRFVNYLAAKKVIKTFTVSLLKDSYKIKPTFDNCEIDLILNSVKPDDDTSVMMLLLLSVGIRSRSLRELHVRDLHLSDRYIEIHKTKSGEPICLPISQAVTEILKEYIAIYSRHGLLFINTCGNKFNRACLAKRINKRLRELGISDEKSGVHIFRHTFGKIMSMNACPTAILQKWLGHSDIRITQRYVDLYGNDLKNTMNMLPTSNFQYI